jgi:hypothetical protein
MTGANYKLVVGGQTYQGKTDSNGIISQVVPSTATSGTVTLDMWSFDVTIKPLDTVESEAGYTTRLENLGYHTADPAQALMRFQSANGLNVTGQMDADTKAKLKEIYGH